jgi:hypothetical protein
MISIDSTEKSQNCETNSQPLNISTDGFVKVCDVAYKGHGDGWIYENINQDVMFDDHRSWVYAIVDGQEIVKIGETGNPLGIRKTRGRGPTDRAQPTSGTASRLGRLRTWGKINSNDNDTDTVIRRNLQETAHQGNVSIWARKCEQIEMPITVFGKEIMMNHSFHKDLEQVYLRKYVEVTGRLPRLNKAQK